MTGFSFQVAVPKFMKLQMSPASSDKLAAPREAQDRLHLQRPAHVGDGAGRKLPRRLLRRVRGTAARCKTRRALSRRLRRAGADGAWDVITRGAFSRRVMRWARRG